MKKGLCAGNFFLAPYEQQENNQEIDPGDNILHNGAGGVLQVFFDRFPGKAGSYGYLAVLHSLFPAHYPYFLLLGREQENGFFKKA